MKQDEIKGYTVRLPLHVLEKLRSAAQQNNRSLNGEILTAIEEHLKKQKKGK
jgi:hypothetical protein